MNITSNNVHGHSFYTNADSIYFTLIKLYQVEEVLSLGNLTINESVEQKHSENAASLLKHIVSYYNDTRSTFNLGSIDNDLPKLNLTTRALIAANLADECLKEYGLAKGLDTKAASDLKVMSIGMIENMYRIPDENTTKMNMGQMSESSMIGSHNNQSFQEYRNLSTTSVTNEVSYGTSSMLAGSLKTLFAENLENSVLQNSTGLMRIPMSMKKDSVDRLDQGIQNLIQTINSKAPLEQVYSIVHGQIHPNLYLAYDLKLKGD